ncbi:hypothetical protein [Streptomyces sp. NPDC048639]|uniref:hypothetical protein n=1 Tax=Streptomyces sp. NPDC048639 TaxID=3365581 RepID=UPI003713E622
MTTLQHSAHVSVHLTDCSPQDADSVFGVLLSAFPAAVDQETGAHCAQHPRLDNPMVWIRTFDVRTSGAADPEALAGPVTADLFGGDRPVRQIEEALARSFLTEEEGHVVPGDQEVQVRLRLSSRVAVPS